MLGVGFPEAGVLAICDEKCSDASEKTLKHGECSISVTRVSSGNN